MQQGSLLSTEAPWVYIAANCGAQRARDRGEERKKVFMVLAVFVLKSSFAKRQNINIVSLFLLVLACDNVPAEASLTLVRGSSVCLGFSLSQVSGEERKRKKKFPLFLSLSSFICFLRV